MGARRETGTLPAVVTHGAAGGGWGWGWVTLPLKPAPPLVITVPARGWGRRGGRRGEACRRAAAVGAVAERAGGGGAGRGGAGCAAAERRGLGLGRGRLLSATSPPPLRAAQPRLAGLLLLPTPFAASSAIALLSPRPLCFFLSPARPSLRGCPLPSCDPGIKVGLGAAGAAMGRGGGGGKV